MNVPTVRKGELSQPRTKETVQYAWQQLLQRAGLTEVEAAFYYHPPDGLHPGRPAVVVVPCCEQAWSELLTRPPGSISALAVSDVFPPDSSPPWDDPIPVPFWGCGCENTKKPFAEIRPDGVLVFYADIIATTFFMLSRWEETVIPERDQHGRFPAEASVACKQGFLNRPIVDEYAVILRAWLHAAMPELRFSPAPFRVKLSHDIDTIRSYITTKKALAALRTALFRQHDIAQTGQVLRKIIRQAAVPSKDAVYRRIYWLAQTSAQYHLQSEFYFLTADPGPWNRHRYKVSSALMQQCFRDLRDLGAKIGLHAGYEAFDDPQRLHQEKERLEKALKNTPNPLGGRQHYLRFQVPVTWRCWEQAGLAYDATLAYASHEGFRCGTCHPFRPFDIEFNRELNLLEQPLIVMDQTLKTYRKMSPEQGEARIIELAQKCQRVNGTFTLLWHNTSFDGTWEPWAEMYERVVTRLAEMQS
jgi:hypothetical protein